MENSPGKIGEIIINNTNVRISEYDNGIKVRNFYWTTDREV